MDSSILPRLARRDETAGSELRYSRGETTWMPGHDPATHGVILFDGTCAFCERSVRFIASRDPDAYFLFGASQTPAAAAMLAPFGVTRETARSLILIEGGHVYLRSTAVLRIARRMRFPWRLASAGLVIPTAMRDPVYRVVAAVRHRLAGTSNACEIPPAEIRDRLIY